MGPMARAVGEPLVFSCAGLYLWGLGSEELHYYQLLPHRPPTEPRPSRADRSISIEPAAITASAINATTTLLALGYADGSVALYDTTVHVPRFELEPHAAPVRFVALDRSARLLSADAAGRVHVYALGAADESADESAPGGRLLLRKPALASAPALCWGTPCACLPLLLASPDDGGKELHVLDQDGARVGKVVAPAGRRFCTAGGGVGAPPSPRCALRRRNRASPAHAHAHGGLRASRSVAVAPGARGAHARVPRPYAAACKRMRTVLQSAWPVPVEHLGQAGHHLVHHLHGC